ncbi:hypothetical protein Scep_019338 [Stephania cephalantha]|uniref:BAH domain-containing protein n=1 Tax=Stephania cephalantha TaxID=152367 RepID=A0AAP0NMT4_9MAGN
MAYSLHRLRNLHVLVVLDLDVLIHAARDCVLMKPAESSKLPYAARVEKIEADARGQVKVRVRWYYSPEESIGEEDSFTDPMRCSCPITTMCRARTRSKGSASCIPSRAIPSLMRLGTRAAPWPVAAPAAAAGRVARVPPLVFFLVAARLPSGALPTIDGGAVGYDVVATPIGGAAAAPPPTWCSSHSSNFYFSKIA